MGITHRSVIRSSLLLLKFDCYFQNLKMSNKWKHGLCGCLHDIRICLCGAFLPCCLICETSEKMGKSGLLYNILGCFAPCIPILLLRQEARHTRNIKGNTAEDVICACCCPELALCQVANEVN